MEVKKNNLNNMVLCLIFILLTLEELVLLNLCIQCLTEFLKIRTCFKIVG